VRIVNNANKLGLRTYSTDAKLTMKVSLAYDVTPLTTEESDKLETGPRTPFSPVRELTRHL